MKRPLLPIVLWFAGGILASSFLNGPWELPCAAAWCLAVAALALPNKRSQILPALLFASGLALHTFHTDTISPVDLRRIAGSEPVLAQIEGTLAAPPQTRAHRYGEIETERTTAVLNARRLRLDGGNWQPVHGRVALSTPGVLDARFHARSAVRLNGILQVPATPVDASLFDYRRHLARQGIHHQFKTESTAEWTLAQLAGSSAAPGWQERFSAWARGNLARGLPEEDEALRLLWAMTLGWRMGLTDEVSEPFMKSGTMHVFAISGLHVALMAGCLLGLLRLLKVPRAWCAYLVIPWLWFYTGATGWPASAIRSSAMMSVVIAGWSLRRPGDLLNSLAGAALLVLLWDPLQLFQTGFQLSFSVVLSLALFGPVFNGLRRRLLQPDPLLPDELRPKWKKVLGEPVHYLTASFTTSLAAWLGSLPLAALYFHYLTPVSLLANVVIIPLSGLALTSCLASVLTGPWLPPVSELFNHSAWFWMRLMIEASERAADLPAAWCHVAAPSPLLLLLYYGTLISVLSGWWRHRTWRPWLATATTALAALWVAQWCWHRGGGTLTILPVGGGDAIFHQPRHGGPRSLIDGGDDSSARYVTVPFLRSRGVNRLPDLLLSHGDIRHVGGLDRILAGFTVDRTHASHVNFRSGAYKRALVELEEANRLRRLSAGDRWGNWRVLHPASDSRHSQADDNALVLMASLEGFEVLLMSDLGFPGQDELLNRHPNLSADIVVAGLPVQTEPAAEGFLHVVNPRVVVICDADYPATQRAGTELRERLARHDRRVLYTSDTGAVHVRWRSARCAIQTSRNRDRIVLEARHPAFLKP